MFGFKDKILSIPFPDTCIVCGAPVSVSEYACKKCLNKIPYISDVFKCRTCLGFLYSSKDGLCGDCLANKPVYSQLISCVDYEGYIKRHSRLLNFITDPTII